MARFKFDLEPVLHHRQMAEDQKQRELAQLLRQRLIYQTQLRDLQETIRSDKHSMKGSLMGRVDVGRIRQHANHSGQTALRVQGLAMELLKLNQQIDQARGLLVEAMQARRAVEILRRKRYERWVVEERRRETAEMDEMATQAYGRRRDDGPEQVGAVA